MTDERGCPALAREPIQREGLVSFFASPVATAVKALQGCIFTFNTRKLYLQKMSNILEMTRYS